MARSALRSSCSQLVPGVATAIPMLTLADTSVPSIVKVRLKELDDPLGDRDHVLLGGGVLEEHGELVAAEAGGGVGRRGGTAGGAR